MLFPHQVTGRSNLSNRPSPHDDSTIKIHDSAATMSNGDDSSTSEGFSQNVLHHQHWAKSATLTRAGKERSSGLGIHDFISEKGKGEVPLRKIVQTHSFCTREIRHRLRRNCGDLLESSCQKFIDLHLQMKVLYQLCQFVGIGHLSNHPEKNWFMAHQRGDTSKS